MNIEVEIRNIYGKTVIYPLCETAKTFARLTNTKTLTSEAITLIKKLGYEIEVKPAKLITL